MLKESKFAVVCAGFLLCALVMKAFISIGGAWLVYPGWGLRAVGDMAAVWIAVRSKVRGKLIGLLFGAFLYIGTAAVLALLEGAGIVEFTFLI